MSDFNSSQPVRTENPGDVAVFLSDATTPTQKAAVDTFGSLSFLLKNASGTAATFTSTSLNVNVTNTVPVSAATDTFPATQTITTQDLVTAATVSGNQTFYTGTPTAGSAATFALSSNETIMLETTGTWTGTLQSEASVDGGTTWVVRSIHLIGSPNFVGSFTTNVIGSGNAAAKTNYRVRAIAAMTGTATIRVVQSSNPSTVYIGNAIKLVDSSSLSTVQANILAASTAALATNTSLVVALSPNSPLPAGSAVIGAVTQSGGPWTSNITQVGGSAISLGQKVSASSFPVVFASDQSTLTVQDLSDGPVTPGAVATKSMLVGVQFNTALPTLTNTQQSAIQADSSGRILVGSIASALPVGTNSIGKVVQDNTVQWLVQDLADGSVGAGTAGTKSMLIGGIFNTALPTLTTGQQAGIQVDSSGRILIGSIASALPTGANTIGAVTQASGPWTQNLTQVGGSAIALGQTTMSASLPVTFASNQSTLTTSDLADGSVGAGTAGTKSMLAGLVFNSALPTLTNGQQAAAQADSSGRLLIGSIASPLPAGTNLLGAVNIDIGGSPNSATNPVFVTLSDTVGTSIDSYQTSAALAAGSSVNLDYTVTAAKTFYAKQLWATASGKIKAVIAFETGVATGVYTTFWVGFNSTSNTNLLIPMPTSKTQIAGARIRVTITNNDKAAMDVYETLSGTEI